MVKKGAFLSIAGILLMIFLVGFTNTDNTPFSDIPAPLSNEHTLDFEKAVSEGSRTGCVADIGCCCLDENG